MGKAKISLGEPVWVREEHNGVTVAYVALKKFTDGSVQPGMMFRRKWIFDPELFKKELEGYEGPENVHIFELKSGAWATEHWFSWSKKKADV